MQKRSSKKRNPRDINVMASHIVMEATSQDIPKTGEGKNAHAVALGRLGGLKGGKARADKLTPERKREIARKAAYVRWSPKSK